MLFFFGVHCYYQLHVVFCQAKLNLLQHLAPILLLEFPVAFLPKVFHQETVLLSSPAHDTGDALLTVQGKLWMLLCSIKRQGPGFESYSFCWNLVLAGPKCC